MKRLGYKNSEWFEVAFGILLLAFGMGVSIFGFENQIDGYIAGASMLSVAGIFLSHVLVRQRWLRVSLLSLGVLGGLGIVTLAILAYDITLFILMSAWVYGLILSDDGVIRGLEDSKSSNKIRPDLLTTIIGFALFGIGTAFAGTSLMAGWFIPHINLILFGSGLFLITSFFFVFIGAGLALSELRGWTPSRKVIMRFIAVVALVVLGATYAISEVYLSSLIFFVTALLLAFGKYGHVIYVIPKNIASATQENLMVRSYQHVGRITLWLIVMLLGGASIYDNITSPIIFVAFALVVIATIFFYRTMSIERYTKAHYLYALIVISTGFNINWWYHGALESRFTLISFSLVLAAAVILKSRWVIIMGLVVWSVPALDILFSAHGHTHDWETFGYFSISLLIVCLYAYFISQQQSRFNKMFNDEHLALTVVLEKEKKSRVQLGAKTKKITASNKELVEMRSALLNVLEDVENSNRQLLINHHRQDAVLSSIGEGLIASDTEGKIILANPASLNILSATHADIIGKSIESVLKFYLGDSQVLDTAVFEETWSGKASRLKDELFLIGNSGKRTPIAGEASPFFDDREHISGIVVVFRDVTEEREIEQQKSSFITVASHQLRTPINAVRWYVDLLLEGDAGKLSKQQKEFLTDISTSIVRMATLIDDLLQVSRAEEGRLDLSLENMSIHKLTEDALREITVITKTRNQAFEVDISNDLPEVYVDKKMVGEVLENLLSNAVKYTPDGGKVGLRVTRSKTDIQFEIWDTGYGIPKEHQHHVFEKFFRGKRAVTMETEGTGLGLYIAKHIIETSKGTIWFESEEGKGSRFFFTLPTAKTINTA